MHAGFLAEEVLPTVPAPVLAEAWRGGSRQAKLARLLALCVVDDMNAEHAEEVGVLAGKSKHDDIVDVSCEARSVVAMRSSPRIQRTFGRSQTLLE